MKDNNSSVENIVRILRCPHCGKKKAIVQKDFNVDFNFTVISTICANDLCGKILHTYNKSGKHI